MRADARTAEPPREAACTTACSPSRRSPCTTTACSSCRTGGRSSASSTSPGTSTTTDPRSQSWGRSDIESYFQTTQTEGGDTALYGGRWTAQRLDGISGYQLVEPEDVWDELYPVGQHPHIEHPPVSFDAGGPETVARGAISYLSIWRRAENGAHPYAFDFVGYTPSWITMGRDGNMRLAPLQDAAGVDVTLRVIDAEEHEAHATLTILVT